MVMEDNWTDIWSPMHIACNVGWWRQVNWLIHFNHTEDINVAIGRPGGLTPLVLAAREGHFRIVKLIFPYVNNSRVKIQAMVFAGERGHHEIERYIYEQIFPFPA